MKKISSQRIEIRDYQKDGSELESVFLFTGDPAVAEHSSWGPLTKVETAEFLQETAAAIDIQPRLNFGLGSWVIATQTLIGHVSLHIRNPKLREAELGYTIRRDHWGQGFATEAARAVLRFGFEDLDLHRIYATTSPGNTASQRVLEKVGFRREGFLKQNVLQRGNWRDSLLYAILVDEFQ